MKVRPSPWTFAPKKFQAAPTPTPENPSEEFLKKRQWEQLQAEHPWMSRGVELLQLSSWIAQRPEALTPWKEASGALAAGTALASAAWGANKLIQGQTSLDRIEGAGHLALAFDNGVSALQNLGASLPGWAPAWAASATFLAAGCEVTVGASDLWRGLREHDSPRAWVGAAQVASGAALAGSLLFPGASGLAQSAALFSMALRQSTLGPISRLRGSD